MATKSKGTLIQYDDTAEDLASASDWTTLATVRGIKPPPRTAGGIDTTHLTSEAMERVPEIPDVGEAEATILYEKTQAATVDALFGVEMAWRVLYPDGSGRSWWGWISEDSDDGVEVNGVIEQTVKIMASGDANRFESEAA